MKLNKQYTNDRVGWQFDNSYARLPESFYAQLHPVPVRAPQVAMLNHALAESLGLDIRALSGEEAALLFAGNVLPDGAQPIAQAYAGHQYGHFTMLGDGRAILLGEHLTPTEDRFDIQLKGSGQTRFSRRGDGRAALAPMLREYIISESMHALNIPTTRSLAVVTTGESVIRETLLPGAILTRVAASHIRVGTFEYVARMEGVEGIKILADYAIHRHYSDLVEAENAYLALLHNVIKRQASLVAKWMLVGFVHGVMNTDNMTISGETIDYGPCAFMDAYDPNIVFSSIDHHGRYRYSNQPLIAQWNLARFAETLLPLLHSDQEKAVALAEEAIHHFSTVFQHHWLAGMRKKLGLFIEEAEDMELIETLLTWMQQHQADYTNTFRALTAEILPDDALFRDEEIITWHTRWQTRLLRQAESKQSSLGLMRAHNPAVHPRNHRVEEALTAASERSDYALLQRLLAAVTNPYTDAPEYHDYRTPPLPSGHVYQTFCGT
ncbi:protein adenylyltransferase SelO [Nitrosomonas sp. Is37]|uniref:protein adenylyltransferase SelO n=1 Tax=Nitrosomonas sp. Is37 TaxID=3080535 RepID=UPI00294AA188|nr:YdiU family protein [Nitrosomonas sp. Is37]MDV6345301.1 YdiU family protein [Nitrosomonas sp. Is37]